MSPHHVPELVSTLIALFFPDLILGHVPELVSTLITLLSLGLILGHVPELVSTLITLFSPDLILGHVPELVSTLITFYRAVPAFECLSIALIRILPKFRVWTETVLSPTYQAVFCQQLAVSRRSQFSCAAAMESRGHDAGRDDDQGEEGNDAYFFKELIFFSHLVFTSSSRNYQEFLAIPVLPMRFSPDYKGSLIREATWVLSSVQLLNLEVGILMVPMRL
jgi:hypothetical protein